MGAFRRAFSLPLPGHGEDENINSNVITNSVRDPDDSYNAKGDLGLGLGLKPGGIQVDRELETVHEISPKSGVLKNDSLWSPTTKSVSMFSLKGPSRRRSNSKSKETEQVQCEEECDDEEFPTVDGVSLGTSIRQQKKLYKHDIQEIINTKGSISPLMKEELDADSHYDSRKVAKSDQHLIKKKLIKAQDDVELLKNELEACQRQLDSKYRAIRILQNQALLAQANQIQTTISTEVVKKKLEKDVNSLQFELELRNGSMMLSEQTWAERFDRVCRENAALMATLEARSDELRKMHSEKMAVIRERDELISMMDVKERLQYERHKTTSDASYTNNTVAEQLSVLGACHCRGNKPEPCGCARAAANLKRDNNRLQDEIHRVKKSWEDTQVIADAYRMAFEEQLGRNKTLTTKLAQWLQKEHKNKSRKKGLNWIGKPLSNGNGGVKEVEANGQHLDHSNGMPNDPENGVNMQKCTVPFIIPCDEDTGDIVITLAELLNDKCEALAHQKMVARMLARRTQDLEERLTTEEGI
ncbi:coiled-coil domain-containing protein 125-like [Saccoglossus kowalevskii]|uniref:Coiled-coil domain-containing protein 125-like n=1 Tax=Saccoglossus kowalevskii TaxID=10224 RepID=A0ABM0N0E4_SACKO|nr:PREDICTED: coiled-coil domain-containing protein 125-like [Saccoglossus kowalevskii]